MPTHYYSARHDYLHRRVMEAASPPFALTDITGLALWLKTSDQSTRFQDAALTTPATAANDPVGGLMDKSGNGFHATQSTAGARPVVKTSEQNGKDVLRFDGVDDRLSLSGSGLGLFRNTAYGYVFAVAKSALTTSALRYLINASTGVSAAAGRAGIMDGLGTGDKLRANGRRLDASSVFNSSPASVGHGTTWHLIGAHFLWASSDLVLNLDGAQIGANTSFDTDGSTSDTDSLAVTIGDVGNGTSFWNGDMAEIAVYARATPLTVGEIVQIRDYLKTEWGTP